jgi:hypothetical protein
MRGITKEQIHKELQDLNPKAPPHKEEILIRVISRANLFSPFPQRDAKIM